MNIVSKKRSMTIRRVLKKTALACAISLFLFTVFFQSFWIPSISMQNTLKVLDRILVFKPHVKWAPSRGSVVVFKFPLEPNRYFVKRIVGLPGDTVEIVSGKVFINNYAITEPYVDYHDNCSMEKLIVPKDQYFVLGDNRPHSQDARYWPRWARFVPKENLVGPVLIRYWPLERFGIVPWEDSDIAYADSQKTF